MPAFEDRPSQQITGMQYPTIAECEPSCAQPFATAPVTQGKEHHGAVAQEHEGAGAPLLSSVTLLPDAQVSALSDADLLSYRKSLIRAMGFAYLGWVDGCWDAKGWHDRLELHLGNVGREIGRRGLEAALWAEVMARADAMGAAA